MLKKFAERHHVALRQGQNIRIFLTLAVNILLRAKLRIFKKLHGITKPIVHYYAVCWNEEAMLPWMFKYYDLFVDRFTIYDNYSTDNTENIIKNNPKAEIIKFGDKDHFDDSANQNIKNTCWKRSRGKADLVVVCDMDEFLYHPDLESLLQRLCKEKISFPATIGYDMFSETFPKYDGLHQLTDLVQQGVRYQWFDKHIIFDPHMIVDTYFDPGAHHANPTGIVSSGPYNTALRLLHYKNLGLDYLLSRHKQLGERLSTFNLNKGFGIHYLATKQEEIKQYYKTSMQSTEKVVD